MAAVETDSHAPPVEEVDDRDVRAATECMIVMREAPGLYRVWSEEREYIVDGVGYACECADSTYRGVKCKHIRRCEFATSARDVPHGIPAEDIDPLLGEALRTQLRRAGGDH